VRDHVRKVQLVTLGMAPGAIARGARWPQGTVSKWQVRFTSDRMTGLSETGDPLGTMDMAPRMGGPPLRHRTDRSQLISELDRTTAGARTGRDPHQYIWRCFRVRKAGSAGSQA
jgi:hypothetical protein